MSTSKGDPLKLPTESLLSGLQNRREFLQLLAKGLGYTALATAIPGCGGGGGDSNPSDPPRTIPQASNEYKVLKRTSFGVHRDELASIEGLGVNRYLEQQLDYQLIDDSALESEIQTLFSLVHQTPAQLVAGFPDNIAEVARQMIAATQYRQMFSPRQLYEVMVEFWTDHFNIHLLNGLGPTLKPKDDLQVIRAHALSNFGDLLHASATSPAMLFYLDNFYNLATAPNENYARELMELHTLGVDGGYTETDIKEVARCFTGWSFRFPDDTGGEYGVFNYIDAIHDPGSKLVLGQTIPAGGGQLDGEQVLDMLARHPSTAQFIATKLCRRFISDTPEAAAIDTVADAFLSSGGDIKAMLRALFATDAFRNSDDLKMTRPSEYLAGLIRALAPDTHYPTDEGQLFFFAQSILGQLPYYWHTPDGYPDIQSYWLSTGGMLNRWRLSFISFAPVISAINVIDIDYESLLNGANTLATLTDTLTDAILMRPLSAVDRRNILAWLTKEYGVFEEATLPTGTPEQIAPLVAAVLVSSAYFQLR
ncbi:MAG: DUF1800 domain-containing protein [Candidatus Thiodiazotropha sp. (ex Notomyrtea botanica)]|nr:DUF1800 domain-containing protein [Candidatus Thiodiazotropha sp. (ex Notomyrtea botanica)]